MPNLRTLKGLKASDRTDEEKKEIAQYMGYSNDSDTLNADIDTIAQPYNITEDSLPQADTISAMIINQAIKYQKEANNQYNKLLAEKQEEYGVNRNSVNSAVNSYIDQLGNEVSSTYKRYKGTDKITINDQQKKQLAAEYDARKEMYGEQHADLWLDQQFKNNVSSNQSWLEWMWNALYSIPSSIEGGAIMAAGNAIGATDYLFNGPREGQSQDLSWWDGLQDAAIDNSITRYGRDVMNAKASNVLQGLENIIGLSDETANERIAETKATATKYNPEGLGAHQIVTNEDQDNSLVSWATPWKALESGGFTALSMAVGAGEAKLAGWIFGNAMKGMNYLNKSRLAFETADKLEKGLVTLRKAQNVVDTFVIPAAVGTMEGAMEGLNTKIEAEREAVKSLDEQYAAKIAKETEEVYNQRMAEYDPSKVTAVEDDNGNVQFIQTPKPDKDEIYQEVWDKYQNEYTESRRQIDWAASKAGIYNFYANSLINGAINQTLKAGIMAPRVQESLRNSRLTGWLYRKPKFQIDADNVVKPVTSKTNSILQLLKEPFGEGLEEYEQNLSSETFSAFAESNINKFIDNKLNGDGTAKVTDYFGSDLAASLTALKGALVDKESIESAILGAVSSSMGTVGGIGTGYHKTEDGKIVKNNWYDYRNFLPGYKNEVGEKESAIDWARRVMPWRSGAINAYFDMKKENAEAEETAAALTEWIKDPANKAKWDGLQGTANWLTQMQNAAESNDQFSYRQAQLGKAINDIFMLEKLKGTEFHNSLMQDLQRAAEGNITEDELNSMRADRSADSFTSDEELTGKIQENAKKMLDLMESVQKESKSLESIFGRIDEDTKQSLIFGKLSEQNEAERKKQLKEEVANASQFIEDSRQGSGQPLDDGLKKLILKHGSINRALRAHESLLAEQEKTDKKVKELKAIEKDKLSEEQEKELAENEKKKAAIEKSLKEYDALYEKDENGKKTNKVNSSLPLLVMNEREIMDLDPVTRAMVLLQGATRTYNATHRNLQKIDELNLEADEIQHKIDHLEEQKKNWTNPNGTAKKHHNKQVKKAEEQIKQLQKQKKEKLKELDAEQGATREAKPVYNSEQQAVIDNLVQQGTQVDYDFLNKVIDLGRLEQTGKQYHEEYQKILSDPRSFENYVKGARINARRNLARRRAERIANIQNYEEFSKEFSALSANAGSIEANDIVNVMREESAKQKKKLIEEADDKNNVPLTNYERYIDNMKKQEGLMKQFVKDPTLTDNDMSLLVNAMQYISGKGIEVTDRDAAVRALVEKDDDGVQGGKFRQWVETKNEGMFPQQRAYMPYYTSLGEIVSQYVKLIDGKEEDDINNGNLNPTITPNTPNPSPSPSAATSPANTGANDTAASQTGGQSSAPQPEPTPTVSQIPDPNGAGASVEKSDLSPEVLAAGAKLMAMGDASSRPEGQISPIEQAFITAKNIVTTNNNSEEAKNLVTDYLEDIALDDSLSLKEEDDFTDELSKKIKELENQLGNGNDDIINDAISLIRTISNRIKVQKLNRGRNRTIETTPAQQQKLGLKGDKIQTANINYMRERNPESWAVKFYDTYGIEEWNRRNVLKDTTVDKRNPDPLYFITNSEWSAEVMQQMQPTEEELRMNPNLRTYNTLVDMPIVIAVKVSAPSNTTIEINGEWYQPVGILPSTEAKSRNGQAEHPGASITRTIRQMASKEQGIHLVTVDGQSNGIPLITYAYGRNYRPSRSVDQPEPGQPNRANSKENNANFIDGVLETIASPGERARLRSLPKEQMLNDNAFLSALDQVVNGLWWDDQGTSKTKTALVYTPDRMRPNSDNPVNMGVYRKDMDETKGRNTDKTLPEVLKDGTSEEVVAFNSRTQNAYEKVIRPLYQYLIVDGKNEVAKIITTADIESDPGAYDKEAERIEKFLNKISWDYIYIDPGSGWRLSVTCPPTLQVAGPDIDSSKSVYRVSLYNDQTGGDIELGFIERVARPSQESSRQGMEILRNLLYDENTGKVRDFLRWQTPQKQGQNLKNKDVKASNTAKKVYAEIIKDGILEFAGSTKALNYPFNGITVRNPFKESGEPLYREPAISNPYNAQPASPINMTLQAEGAIMTNDGGQVEPSSGASLDNSNQQPSSSPAASSEEMKKRKREAVKKVVDKIVMDSEQFTLSEDENYYYIEDKVTGERTKYLRVTTVIGADNSLPELTEKEAEKARVRNYVWTPTVRQIYDHLKKNHSLQEMSDDQLAKLDTLDKMSSELQVPTKDIKRAVAELRTEYKKNKYGLWGTPSTAIGDTYDAITRDFLSDNLKDEYPNISKEMLDEFVNQLTLFKDDLDQKGIHIVSKGVMAWGSITATDNDGNNHDVLVAGTLDLFGYDDDGNFYIFDMKTTRDHTNEKLEYEKFKWARQISMYADLLKQKYGQEGVNFLPQNLIIIPINVDYPAPKGTGKFLNPGGPVYSVIKEGEKKGQLQVTYGRENPVDFVMPGTPGELEDNGDNRTGMRRTEFYEQFRPGQMRLNINWDNLSSEDQDLAENITQQVHDNTQAPVTLQSATIETPAPVRNTLEDGLGQGSDYSGWGPLQQAPPVVANGETPVLPDWENLNQEQKKFILENPILEIADESDYNLALSDPDISSAVFEALSCAGLI